MRQQKSGRIINITSVIGATPDGRDLAGMLVGFAGVALLVDEEPGLQVLADAAYAGGETRSCLRGAGVDKWARAEEKASDHAPTWIDLA